MKKVIFSFAILAMMFLVSCTKPKPGPTGPEGPTGPAGTNGTNGAVGTAGTNGTNGTNGTDGTNGINGNANVIGTNTVALTSSSWLPSSNTFYATITATGITQAIMDKGIVMVYEQSGSGSSLSWRALPYTSGIVSKFFVFYLNTAMILYQNTDGSQTANPGNQTYRLVIISASVAKANPNVNWGNYEEAMKILK